MTNIQVMQVLGIFEFSLQISFEKILSASNINVNPVEQSKIKKFLLDKNLLEPSNAINDYGVILQLYKITANGLDIFNSGFYMHQLDLIINWLSEKFKTEGIKTSYYSIEEICKTLNIDFSVHFEPDLIESTLLEMVSSKNGNTFRIKPVGYKLRLQMTSNYFLDKYLNEALKTSTSNQPVAQRSFHVLEKQHPNIYHIHAPQGNVFTSSNVGNIGSVETNKPVEKTIEPANKKNSWGDTITRFLKLPDTIYKAIAGLIGIWGFIKYIYPWIVDVLYKLK